MILEKFPTSHVLFNRNQGSKLSQDEQDSNLLLVPGIMNAPRTPGVDSGQVSYKMSIIIQIFIRNLAF